ncbi:hypothetical protein CYMTET_53610 [Cymbomonas tetramitiformis]|uniref:EF-hand domain-containing protein n=1 Tax=Cymbomonas tetramitiformis TaxID=36881 RepID=A0AAE0BI01_9CHLO|nr:hypothetical protein CYMTET_53610 [Cymbomonas tetramitiformis]
MTLLGSIFAQKKEALKIATMLGSSFGPFQALRDDCTVTRDQLIQLLAKAAEDDATQAPFELTVGKFYRTLDRDNKGFISKKDLHDFFHDTGDSIPEFMQVALLTAIDSTLLGESFTEEELKVFLKHRRD